MPDPGISDDFLIMVGIKEIAVVWKPAYPKHHYHDYEHLDNLETHYTGYIKALSLPIYKYIHLSLVHNCSLILLSFIRVSGLRRKIARPVFAKTSFAPKYNAYVRVRDEHLHHRNAVGHHSKDDIISMKTE